MDAIDPIKAAIERLDQGDYGKIAAVAPKFGVDRTRLSKRWRGLQGSRNDKYENDRAFNTNQEIELVQYIEKLCKRGIAPTYEMMRNFAAEISQKYIGKNGVYRFLERHHLEVFSKYTAPLDRNRYQADFC